MELTNNLISPLKPIFSSADTGNPAVAEWLDEYQKVWESLQSKPQVHETKQQNNSSSTGTKLAIPDRGECRFIDKSDIMYAEASGSYTIIYLHSGDKIIVSKNLKNLISKLDSQVFIRTHKSFLVNIKFMDKYVKNDGGYVLLNNGKSIPVSVRKREMLTSFINSLSL